MGVVGVVVVTVVAVAVVEVVVAVVGFWREQGNAGGNLVQTFGINAFICVVT